VDDFNSFLNSFDEFTVVGFERISTMVVYNHDTTVRKGVWKYSICVVSTFCTMWLSSDAHTGANLL